MNSLLPAVIHIDKIPPVAFAAFFLFIVVIASTFGILLLLNRKYRFVANIDAVTGLYTNWKFCIEARKMLDEAGYPNAKIVAETKCKRTHQGRCGKFIARISNPPFIYVAVATVR